MADTSLSTQKGEEVMADTSPSTQKGGEVMADTSPSTQKGGEVMVDTSPSTQKGGEVMVDSGVPLPVFLFHNCRRQETQPLSLTFRTPLLPAHRKRPTPPYTGFPADSYPVAITSL